MIVESVSVVKNLGLQCDCECHLIYRVRTSNNRVSSEGQAIWSFWCSSVYLGVHLLDGLLYLHNLETYLMRVIDQ